ncbi:Cytochrome P450 3A8 [Halotydeus destructor]|nr:Cytochrome P450 3A8 [Halotydeus destructor]
MDPITLWFILLSFVISIYVNFIRSYWTRKGIPTPSAFDIRRYSLPLHLHDTEIYKTYGTIVGLYEGLRPTLMIGDPKLIKDILVKDFHNFPNHRAFNFGHTANRLGFFFMRGSEERWGKMRNAIAPSFCTGKMRLLTPKINEAIGTLLANLRTGSTPDTPVDLRILYRAFSLDTIASTAFGISLDSHNDPDHPIVANAHKFFSKKPVTRFFFEIYLTFAKLKKMRPTDFESLNYFSKLTEKITREKRYLRKRKYSGGLINGKKLDFIQMFLDIIDNGQDPLIESIEEELSADEASNDEPRSEIDNVTVYGHDEKCVPKDSNNNGATNVHRKSFSLDELKAQGILFFLAGFDTTATLLSNISYLLACNPQAQEMLIMEIDTWDSEYELNFDTVNSFKYLDAVIWETLRLYPPVSRVERECVADYKLGSTGICIPAGMTVSIPVYAIHRDPKYFPEPDKFQPERFLRNSADESPVKHPYSFLPFGGGPRNCLGMRLAIIEAKMTIASILKRYRFRIKPGTDVQYYSDQSLIAPKEMPLCMDARDDAVLPKKRINNRTKRLVRQFTW